MALELQMQTPGPTREQRIREVFEQNGAAMTTRALARACIAAGVWTPEELELMVVGRAQDECRRVLSKKDNVGLPVASMTTERDEDGQPLWKVRQLWLPGDYALNVKEHVVQRNGEHVVAVLLARECEDRYGHVIDIPELPAV